MLWIERWPKDQVFPLTDRHSYIYLHVVVNQVLVLGEFGFHCIEVSVTMIHQDVEGSKTKGILAVCELDICVV